MSVFREIIEKSVSEIECSNAPASAATLQDAQKKLGCVFGTQLKCYLLEFGYVAYGANELYGVNERQKLNSDLVNTTSMLHTDFPITKGLVAIDNQGDGDYILCDHQDMVYEFIPSVKMQLISLNKDLQSYIIERLKN